MPLIPEPGRPLESKALDIVKANVDLMESLLDDIVLSRFNPDEVMTCASKLRNALESLRRAEAARRPPHELAP